MYNQTLAMIQISNKFSKTLKMCYAYGIACIHTRHASFYM